MNEASFSSLLSIRQAELHEQFAKAFDKKEMREIHCLEARWVHRYGLDKLPNSLQYENSLEFSRVFEKNSSNHSYLVEELNEKEFNRIEQEEDFFHESKIDPKSENTSSKSISIKEDKSENKIESPIDNDLKPKIIAPRDYVSSPPPLPTIRHLRRWIPAIEEDIPNAS